MSLAQAQHPARPDSPAAPIDARLYSLLRDARQEAVRIRAAVAGAGSGTPGSADRLSTPVPTAMLASVTTRIEQRLADARQALDRDDRLADRWSDAVQRISDLWDDARDTLGTVQNGQPSTEALLSRLDAMIVAIGVITIPPRAIDSLRALKVGGVMDFHKEFSDEIPTEAARTRILSWINDHPLTVPGVVDVQTGTIVKASPLWWRRALSWVGICLIMAAALLAATTSRHWIDALAVGKVPQRVADHSYLLAIAFAYAGAVLHVLVSAMKQYRDAAARNGGFTALGNFTLWVHIHEGYLMLYALAIPVAGYTLILATGRINLVTLFFLGYSIDSILDVLLTRFDMAAKKRTELVVRALR